MSKLIDLSIIIPAYSEEKRIGRTLDELSKFIIKDSFFKTKNVEVLVVAAEAADKTHQIVTEKTDLFHDLKLLKPGPHVGKGRDVRFGMQNASGKVAIFMDADLATPLYHLKIFYEQCIGGSDIVIGTRNLLKFRSSWIRNIFSYVGNMLYQLGSGIWIEDTQCGFKMFNQRARALCFSKLTIMGWDFDIELLAIARANKLKIKTFRIDDWQDMPYSTHNDGFVRISMRTTKDFWRVMINRFKGVYS